jgi:hypothetical protein
MGRRPSKPGSIVRLRERKKASGRVFYYYDTGGKDRKEIPLGSDYGLAIMEYAKLERDRTATDLVAKVITFRYVAEKYMVDVVPTKGTATQADNKRELKNLIAFFDDPPAPLETIEPLHVRQYLTWRKRRHCSAPSGITLGTRVTRLLPIRARASRATRNLARTRMSRMRCSSACTTRQMWACKTQWTSPILQGNG